VVYICDLNHINRVVKVAVGCRQGGSSLQGQIPDEGQFLINYCQVWFAVRVKWASLDRAPLPRMDLHFTQAIFLLFAAVIAGALNALAGGGSFISFPALLFIRIPAVLANATNTVALWPGLAASTIAYLKRLNAPARVLVPLAGDQCWRRLGGSTAVAQNPAAYFSAPRPLATARRNAIVRLRQFDPLTRRQDSSH
jgi:hypothetical protein